MLSCGQFILVKDASIKADVQKYGVMLPIK